MIILTKLWMSQCWSDFATLFKYIYEHEDDAGKLRLIRSLLCEYLDHRALSAVLSQMPELKVKTLRELC